MIRPGGPYFKWPWQRVHKVSVATQATELTWDPTKDQDTIEAVTKDNLTTGVNGQIRYRVSESNLYPFLFGVESPLEHVTGYFVSVLRERIANFVDPQGQALLAKDEVDGEQVSGVELSEEVSINDPRKNLPLLNKYMEEQCRSTPGRYGIELEAALITEIDPPPEVDQALSAINSTRNQIAADINTARADADQQITMSKRSVEIARNNALAEVASLKELAQTLTGIKGEAGQSGLKAYLRNVRLSLLARTRRIVLNASLDEVNSLHSDVGGFLVWKGRRICPFVFSGSRWVAQEGEPVTPSFGREGLRSQPRIFPKYATVGVRRLDVREQEGRRS